ncbi:methyltransferase domain-containing protein, partial [candidate division GN15 bacterium]|nr:methyltransferase domain-containing protein [candidate division GN15 bacterium]
MVYLQYIACNGNIELIIDVLSYSCPGNVYEKEQREVMDFLREQLKNRQAGRVLDIATGEGEFLAEVLEKVGSFDEAVGIDLNEQRMGDARNRNKDARVSFQAGDALALTFEDDSFDTVSVRNSLHHVDEPSRLLSELHRVLKPGGTAVIMECVRDSSTMEQRLYVEMHHWWGEINRAQGIKHNATYWRDEL